MKNIINNIVTLCLLLGCIYSCKPSDYYYADYLANGEIYYPGRIDSLIIVPGNKRANLVFRMTTDSKVKSLNVYLRNSLSAKEKVMIYNVEKNEYGKNKVISLDNLEEANYSVTVYSFANDSDSSRAVRASQFIYGTSYNNTLTNRTFLRFDITNPNEPLLFFNKENNLPKEGTFYPMQLTEVSFVNVSGDTSIITVTPYKEFVSLKNIASPSKIRYRTGYKPVQASLDIFYTPYRELDYLK